MQGDTHLAAGKGACVCAKLFRTKTAAMSANSCVGKCRLTRLKLTATAVSMFLVFVSDFAQKRSQ